MNERIEVLVRSIKNGSREEIWEAAKELFSIAADVAVFLTRLLQSAERAESRAAAAWVLGFSGYASARESLEQVLANANEELLVRAQSAEALGYIGDPRSVPLLVEHLGEENQGIRYWCTFALGQIGDPGALSALRRAAEAAGDEAYDNHSLRDEALDAISQIEHCQSLRR
jgi:HEAT repeat protein